MVKNVNLLSQSKVFIFRLFFIKSIDWIYSRSRTLVIGDSHAEIFNQLSFVNFSSNLRFYICSVGGATVSGLSNPNSATQAAPIFKRWFKLINPSYVIFLMGEVDTGFLLWLRQQKTGSNINDLLNDATTKYKQFIKEMNGSSKTIVISAPLPTIKDGQVWGNVANARKQVKASQKERTNLTQLFNSEMEIWAIKEGFFYINLDALSVGSDGLVSPDLLNTDSNDHHYSNEAYSFLVKRKLRSYLP